MPAVKSFAETLNKLMKEKKLTAKAVSEQTGIPRSTLAEWVAGRQPKLSTDLVKLAMTLNVSLEYLITGRDPGIEYIKQFASTDNDEFFKLHTGVYRITVERKK